MGMAGTSLPERSHCSQFESSPLPACFPSSFGDKHCQMVTLFHSSVPVIPPFMHSTEDLAPPPRIFEPLSHSPWQVRILPRPLWPHELFILFSVIWEKPVVSECLLPWVPAQAVDL